MDANGSFAGGPGPAFKLHLWFLHMWQSATILAAFPRHLSTCMYDLLEVFAYNWWWCALHGLFFFLGVILLGL